MKKILLPLILLIIGVGGGVGAGLFLIPPAEEDHMIAEAPCGDPPAEEHAEETVTDNHNQSGEIITEGREYARLNNQFIVPVVRNGSVTSLVVLSLSVEVETGNKEAIFSLEPRLRDLFLQVLFDHANIGGFDGAFTASSNMRILRDALRHTAITNVGNGITDVLILDIIRQDVGG